jgi:1,4-dihydroxy-2-naphthoate octaprenyltransferase
MLFLVIGWLLLGVFLAVQRNWIGVTACLLGGGIMGAALVYTRRRRGSG